MFKNNKDLFITDLGCSPTMYWIGMLSRPTSRELTVICKRQTGESRWRSKVAQEAPKGTEEASWPCEEALDRLVMRANTDEGRTKRESRARQNYGHEEKGCIWALRHQATDLGSLPPLHII